jgi:hypothetical protein
MTDEELMKRLREGATWDDDVAAADRIEALTADRVKNNKDYCALMERYDALTEQLEAARADAKEAEAYAEELEKERDHWQGVAGREGVCMTCHGPRGAPEPYGCSDCLNTGYCGEWHNQMQELREKLAKAVEALTDIVKDCEAEYPPSHGAIKYFCRATLAEIEVEKT